MDQAAPNKGITKIWTLPAQEWIATLSCIAMFVGFICARALMSIGMITLFINALHPQVAGMAWQKARRSPFAILALLFFLSYLLSGLWSADREQWSLFTTMKLPFIILPFAFFTIPFHKRKCLLAINLAVGAVLLVAVGYSVGVFLSDIDYYIQGYSASHMIPTTKYGDHIRFSLSLALFVLNCLYFVFEARPALSRALRWCFGIAAVIFAAYLHLLSAKTGLMCLYIVVGLYFFIKLARRSRMISYLFVLSMAALVAGMYFFVPTFRGKIDYISEEVRLAREGKLDYNYSDVGRIISYKVWAHEFRQHPWAGVGAGDVLSAMDEGYRALHPEVPEENRLKPHNQFLCTSLAVGTMVVFLIGMVFAPLRAALRDRFLMGIVTLCLLAVLMVEHYLEVQFGVFVYLFFTLYWLNKLSPGKEQTSQA